MRKEKNSVDKVPSSYFYAQRFRFRKVSLEFRGEF